MREWDASFHVASCLDRRPVVRGSQTAKSRREPPQQPAVVGFRGLRILRSSEAVEPRDGLRGAFGPSSASAPSSLFGPMPTIPLRPISSAGAVHSGSSNALLPLAPFASVEGLRPATVAPHAEAELMARLGRIKSELQAARRQHDAAVDDAEEAVAALAAAEAAHRERKACLGALRIEVRAQGALAVQMRVETAAAVERAQEAQEARAARAEAEGAAVTAAAAADAAADGTHAQPAATADPVVVGADGSDGRDGAASGECGLDEEWDGSEDSVALLPGQPPMDAERLLIESRGGGSFALLCGGLGLGLASPEEPMRVPLGVLMRRAEALAEACGAMREEREQLEASSRVMEARLIFADLDPPDGLLREHHLRACAPLAARVPPLVWRRAIEGTKRDGAAPPRTPSQRTRPGGGGGAQQPGGASMDEASFVAFLEWFRQPTAPEALAGWLHILDMDGDGVLSEADLRSAARANAAIAGGGATGAELRAEIDGRIAQLHALVQSSGGSDFSPDSLLATPFDQFVCILFGLPMEHEEQAEAVQAEAELGADERE